MSRRAILLLALLALLAVAPAKAQPKSDARTELHAGERVAEVVALVTGVPVSPLLGISGLSAYRWWRTPEPLRAALPWYAQPAFWGTGLFLAFLFAANTTIGSLLPGLKKPMDFVEHYENQVSAVVASPIVLVEAHRILSGGFGGAAEAAASPGSIAPALSAAGVAALADGAALPAILRPLAELGGAALALVAYALVFLAFHAVQVLIALSPSAILDLLLRLFRLGVLAIAATLTAVHPYFGALFGVLLLAVALLVAGWSFRLCVFGTVFGRDLLFGGGEGAEERLSAFAGSGLPGVPVRSYGRLEGEPGAWRFTWRPWLVLPRRTVAIAGQFALRRGFLSPVLFQPGVVREPSLARFPPRFKGAEDRLAARLGATEIRDGRIVRGVKAAWAWVKALVRGDESGASSGSTA